MSSSNIPPSSSGPAVPHTPWRSPHASEGEHSNPGRVEVTFPSDSRSSSNSSTPDQSPAQTLSIPAPPISPAAETSSVAAQTPTVPAQTTSNPTQTTSVLVQTTSASAQSFFATAQTSVPAQRASAPSPAISLVAAQTTSITTQTASLPVQTTLGPPQNPSQLPDTPREYQYTNCNECQARDPNYVGCDHPDEIEPTSAPEPESVHTAVILGQVQHLYLPTPPGPVPPMLRCSALKALFKENLNEDAKAIFLTTTHGVLLATSPASIPSATFRKAGALGGLTWRVTVSILAGHPAANYTAAKPLKTLSQRTVGDGKALATLVVQFEEGVVVLCHMKENLLVGVLGAAGGVGEEGGMAEGEGEGGEHGGEGEGGDGVGEGGSGGDGEGSGEKGWEGAEKHAEAMAAYLRVEMQGFSMPNGIE